MPVQHQLFRASPTTHAKNHFETLGNIDRESRAMFGVIGMETGIALGHDVEADIRTLEIMAALGNKTNAESELDSGNRTGKESKKIRQRFGHPGISEGSTVGKTLGYCHNFRVVGAKLLHDTQFLEAAKISPAFSSDPIEYIFTMAEQSPEFLNESAVIDSLLVWRFSDGSERELNDDEYRKHAWGELTAPEGAVNDLPTLRPEAYVFQDVVSEGALTNSLMSKDESMQFLQSAFSGTSSSYSHELYDLLDRFRESYKIPLDALESKASTIISKYVASRERNVTQPAKDGTTMAKSKVDRKKLAQMALSQDEGTVEEGAVEEGYIESDVVVTDDTVFTESEEEAGIVEASAGEDEAEPTIDEDLNEIGEMLSEEDDEDEQGAGDEEFTALAGTVAQLQIQLDAYEGRFSQLVGLMKQQAQMLQVLNRNQRRLSGDTIVSERVPQANPANTGLEDFQDFPGLQPIAPTPANLINQGPQAPQTVGKDQFTALLHTDPNDLALAGDTPSRIGEKAISAQRTRQARYNMHNRS